MIKLRTLLLQSRWFYLFFILILVFSFLYTNFYKFNSLYNINEKNFNLIITKYKIDADKLSLELLGKEKLVGTYYFNSTLEATEFKKKYNIGDVISVIGKLKSNRNNTIPNTFNYKKYLYNKKIYYTLKIEKFTLYQKNSNIFYKIKNNFYKRVEDINNNSYLYAFILGEKSYIDSEIFKTYKENGVTHLFALSGLHVSVLSGIIIFLLKRFKISEILIYSISFILLLLLCFITGFSPSILRASLLFLFLGINKVYYFYVKSSDILLLVGSILILINPFIIYELSFLLSFVITYFLLLNSKWFGKNFFISLLKVSIISFLASLPIIINNFYTVNILGILNNLFFVPYVTFFIYPFSLSVFIMPKLELLYNYSLFVIEKVSILLNNINILVISFPVMPAYLIILYYIFLIIFSFNKKIYNLIIILIILIITYFYPYFNKNENIYFLDVGQGDSILIITKNNKAILIDTGGIQNYYDILPRNNSSNLMIDTLIPFFKSIGLSKIDYLILTHGDYDHAGYARDLQDNFIVKTSFINNGNVNELEEKIKNYKRMPDYMNIDNIRFYSLNTNFSDDENESSIVLLVDVSNYKFLFMADANIKVEKDIIKKHNLKNIDVLKVGHHGSKTSSSTNFIDTINPTYALISVGENNKFNHPNQETLDNLKHTNIYRTDYNGSIIFKIKNNKLEIKTCKP